MISIVSRIVRVGNRVHSGLARIRHAAIRSAVVWHAR